MSAEFSGRRMVLCREFSTTMILATSSLSFCRWSSMLLRCMFQNFYVEDWPILVNACLTFTNYWIQEVGLLREMLSSLTGFTSWGVRFHSLWNFALFPFLWTCSFLWWMESFWPYQFWLKGCLVFPGCNLAAGVLGVRQSGSSLNRFVALGSRPGQT